MDKNELTWKDVQILHMCIIKADYELSLKEGEEKKLYELALKKFNNYGKTGRV